MDRKFEFYKLILFSYFYLIYFIFRGFYGNCFAKKYNFLPSRNIPLISIILTKFLPAAYFYIKFSNYLIQFVMICSLFL